MVGRIKAFANQYKINESYVWAGIIVLGIFLWMISGQFGSDSAQSSVEAGPGTGSTEEKVISVQAKQLVARPHIKTITIRGKTEAKRIVTVRAETVGKVIAVPANKGSHVSEGDILCELSLDAREALLEQARAAMRQSELEYEAAKKLRAQGHRSETQEAAAEAAFNAAQAAVKEIEVEIEHIKIRAPFGGLLDDRLVEIGDYMQKGDACAILIDQQPFLVTGQLSEQEVALVELGSDARATLVDGQTHSGKVSFIGASADPATRTFRIEIEVPNEERDLRDGVTAEIKIPLRAVPSHKVPPSSLVLNDAGQLGVRLAESDDRVKFHAVTILADDPTGVWVTGLPASITLIVVGQDYVKDGQKISVTLVDDGAPS